MTNYLGYDTFNTYINYWLGDKTLNVLVESLGWWKLDSDATLVNGPMKAKGKNDFEYLLTVSLRYQAKMW